MGDIAFGFQAAPASDVHKSDQAMYRVKSSTKNAIGVAAVEDATRPATI